jgi:hypothetical protein
MSKRQSQEDNKSKEVVEVLAKRYVLKNPEAFR